MRLDFVGDNVNLDLKISDLFTKINGSKSNSNGKKRHPRNCECPECIDKLFIDDSDVLIRNKKESNDLQKKIYKDSRKEDEKIINDASKVKNIFNSEIKLVNVMNKLLSYTTGCGIIFVSLNMIIRSIIGINISNIVGNAISLIILAYLNSSINENIRS